MTEFHNNSFELMKNRVNDKLKSNERRKKELITNNIYNIVTSFSNPQGSFTRPETSHGNNNSIFNNNNNNDKLIGNGEYRFSNKTQPKKVDELLNRRLKWLQDREYNRDLRDNTIKTDDNLKSQFLPLDLIINEIIKNIKTNAIIKPEEYRKLLSYIIDNGLNMTIEQINKYYNIFNKIFNLLSRTFDDPNDIPFEIEIIKQALKILNEYRISYNMEKSNRVLYLKNKIEEITKILDLDETKEQFRGTFRGSQYITNPETGRQILKGKTVFKDLVRRGIIDEDGKDIRGDMEREDRRIRTARETKLPEETEEEKEDEIFIELDNLMIQYNEIEDKRTREGRNLKQQINAIRDQLGQEPL